MNKLGIIKILNKTDDYKIMGFRAVGDDGTVQLLVKKHGRGLMQICRYETEEGVFYDGNISGWYTQQYNRKGGK